MAPTILVIGATGNNGKSVITQLSRLIDAKSHKILGLTRTLSSPTVTRLAQLPNVSFEEKDWTTLNASWLKERSVEKAFVVSHNGPTQFIEESALYLALLQASVKYVVRISTHPGFIGPTSSVYYGRTHWSMEDILSQPEYKSMSWTSLRPNFYANMFLASTVGWIKEYQRSKQQAPLTLTLDATAKIALVDPADVGRVAAHLLAVDDYSSHNRARYVISGPEDTSGEAILAAVEEIVGTRVDQVEYRDVSWMPHVVPANLIESVMSGCDVMWDGTSSLRTSVTSAEVKRLSAPSTTFRQVLDGLLTE